MKMEQRREVITEILKEHSCLTAKEIANFAIRKYNTRMSLAQVTGALRPMRDKSQVATSVDAAGATVYWLVK